LLRVVPDLTVSNLARAGPGRIYQLKSNQSRILEEFVLGSLNNTPDETNGVNNAVSCQKEAAQFSLSFVMSLFASFWQNLWNGNQFCIFIIRVTLTENANTPLHRSAALVLSVIN